MAIGDRSEIQQLEAEQGNILMYVTREEIGTYFYHGADRPQYKIVAARVVNTLGRRVTFRIILESTSQTINYPVDPPGTTVELTPQQSDIALSGYSISVIT